MYKPELNGNASGTAYQPSINCVADDCMPNASAIQKADAFDSLIAATRRQASKVTALVSTLIYNPASWTAAPFVARHAQAHQPADLHASPADLYKNSVLSGIATDLAAALQIDESDDFYIALLQISALMPQAHLALTSDIINNHREYTVKTALSSLSNEDLQEAACRLFSNTTTQLCHKLNTVASLLLPGGDQAHEDGAAEHGLMLSNCSRDLKLLRAFAKMAMRARQLPGKQDATQASPSDAFLRHTILQGAGILVNLHPATLRVDARPVAPELEITVHAVLTRMIDTIKHQIEGPRHLQTLTIQDLEQQGYTLITLERQDRSRQELLLCKALMDDLLNAPHTTCSYQQAGVYLPVAMPKPDGGLIMAESTLQTLFNQIASDQPDVMCWLSHLTNQAFLFRVLRTLAVHPELKSSIPPDTSRKNSTLYRPESTCLFMVGHDGGVTVNVKTRLPLAQNSRDFSYSIHITGNGEAFPIGPVLLRTLPRQ